MLLQSILVAVPSTIAALAAWRSSSRTHSEVKTNHGRRQGEYIERIASDILYLKTTVVTKNEFQSHERNDKEFQDRIIPLLEKGTIN